MPTFNELFTDVAWANGDTITEVKLDQMIANDRYLRENHDFRVLACAEIDEPFTLSVSTGNPAPTSATLIFNTTIDGATAFVGTPTFSQSTASWSTRSDTDVSISAVTEGLHYITVSGHPSVTSSRRFYFVKTNEVEFGSLWVQSTLLVEGFSASGSFDFYRCKAKHSFTIIGHRTAQGW